MKAFSLVSSLFSQTCVAAAGLDTDGARGARRGVRLPIRKVLVGFEVDRRRRVMAEDRRGVVMAEDRRGVVREEDRRGVVMVKDRRGRVIAETTCSMGRIRIRSIGWATVEVY